MGKNPARPLRARRVPGSLLLPLPLLLILLLPQVTLLLIARVVLQPTALRRIHLLLYLWLVLVLVMVLLGLLIGALLLETELDAVMVNLKSST